MNWEQKLEALNALAPCQLLMRKPGDWYVSQNVERTEGSFLVSAYGNGCTPEEAVNDHWRAVAEESTPTQPVVLNAYSLEGRREVYWRGFMWADVPRTGSTVDAAKEGGR